MSRATLTEVFTQLTEARTKLRDASLTHLEHYSKLKEVVDELDVLRGKLREVQGWSRSSNS